MINIRDFGAVGDGITLDSPKIQNALDYCFEQGGGTVIFPAGKYLCASMRIYSNTCVKLEAGAVVIACKVENEYSKKRGKYDDDFTRDARVYIGEKLGSIATEDKLPIYWEYRCFLQALRNRTDNIFCAINASNVSIIGEGEIFGDQLKFFYETPYDEDTTTPRWMKQPESVKHFIPHIFRPGTIVFLNCKHINLSGIKMIKSSFFNIRVLDSYDVHISRLYIEGDLRCINSDGINISGSKNVFVDCVILIAVMIVLQ